MRSCFHGIASLFDSFLLSYSEQGFFSIAVSGSGGDFQSDSFQIIVGTDPGDEGFGGSFWNGTIDGGIAADRFADGSAVENPDLIQILGRIVGDRVPGCEKALL